MKIHFVNDQSQIVALSNLLLCRSERGLQLKHPQTQGKDPLLSQSWLSMQPSTSPAQLCLPFPCAFPFHPGLLKSVPWKSFLTWSIGSHMCRSLKMWTVCFLNSIAWYSFSTMWIMIANSPYHIHKQTSRPWFIQLFTQYSSALKGVSLFNYSLMGIIAFWTYDLWWRIFLTSSDAIWLKGMLAIST